MRSMRAALGRSGLAPVPRSSTHPACLRTINCIRRGAPLSFKKDQCWTWGRKRHRTRYWRSRARRLRSQTLVLRHLIRQSVVLAKNRSASTGLPSVKTPRRLNGTQTWCWWPNWTMPLMRRRRTARLTGTSGRLRKFPVSSSLMWVTSFRTRLRSRSKSARCPRSWTFSRICRTFRTMRCRMRRLKRPKTLRSTWIHSTSSRCSCSNF